MILVKGKTRILYNLKQTYMRHIHNRLFILCFFLASAVSASHVQPLKQLTKKSKPVNQRIVETFPQTATSIRSLVDLPYREESFFWIEDWSLMQSINYTYSPTGKVLMAEEIADNEAVGRTLYVYDEDDKLFEFVYEVRENQVWIPFYRITYLYDSQGLESGFYYYNWNNGNWMLDWGFRNNRSYNAQNQLLSDIVESFNVDLMIWVGNSSTIFSYDNNARVTEIIESYADEQTQIFIPESRVRLEYEGENQLPFQLYFDEYSESTMTWMIGQRLNDLVFTEAESIFEADLLNAVFYVPNGNSWDVFYRQTTLVLEYNGRDALFEFFADGNWYPENRNLTEYDFKGNLINEKQEFYFDETWTISVWQTQDNSYDEQDRLIEKVNYYWDSELSEMVNSTRVLYFYDQIVSTTEHDASFRIFPNPAVDYLVVETANNQPSELIIYSIQGQLLKRQFIQQTEVISVDELHSGVYILEVVSKADDKKSTVKFIKQ